MSEPGKEIERTSSKLTTMCSKYKQFQPEKIKCVPIADGFDGDYADDDAGFNDELMMLKISMILKIGIVMLKMD